MKLLLIILNLLCLSSLGWAQTLRNNSRLEKMSSYLKHGAGNGGDGVTCHDGKFYALDYVLTLRTREKLGDYPRVDAVYKGMTDERQILKEIAARLKNQLEDTLGDSLLSFERLLDNIDDDWGADRIWLTSSEKLADDVVNDESMIHTLTTNCLTHLSEEEPIVINQITVYENSDGIKKYQFDASDIDQLRKTSSLQVAIHYLHEWLRDYLMDAAKIRRVITYLLSSRLETDAQEKTSLVFARMGMKRFQTDFQEKLDERDLDLRSKYYAVLKEAKRSANAIFEYCSQKIDKNFIRASLADVKKRHRSPYSTLVWEIITPKLLQLTKLRRNTIDKKREIRELMSFDLSYDIMKEERMKQIRDRLRPKEFAHRFGAAINAAQDRCLKFKKQLKDFATDLSWEDL